MKVYYFYLYSLFGCDVTEFESEYVFALGIDFTVGSFLPLLDRLVVFYFGLFLFFDDAFHPLVAKSSNKSINTNIRVYGEAIFQLKIFVGWILVSL